MTKETPAPGNDTGLSPDTLERLNQFMEWTGTAAPARHLDEDGAPTTALLMYCRKVGLSLDWLFGGEVRGLVMRSHHAASKHVLNTEFLDEGEDWFSTWEDDLTSVLLRADAKQRQIMKKAAFGRLSGKNMGDVLWQMVADLDSYSVLQQHPETKGQA